MPIRVHKVKTIDQKENKNTKKKRVTPMEFRVLLIFVCLFFNRRGSQFIQGEARDLVVM
jgi:hypothetical protein